MLFLDTTPLASVVYVNHITTLFVNIDSVMGEYRLQFPMIQLDSALCMFDIASIRYNGIKINMARKPETI